MTSRPQELFGFVSSSVLCVASCNYGTLYFICDKILKDTFLDGG